MYVDVPRSLDLTSSSAVDVAHPYAPPSVDVDVARPAYGLTLPLSSMLAHRRLMYLGLVVLMCVGLCPTWACVSLGR